MGLTKTYLVILGDVAGSRDVEDRAELQRQLRDGLRVIHGQPATRGLLAAEPEISAGDEIQVLVAMAAEENRLPGYAALSILDQLSEVLRPHRIVFGLGLGTLTTGLGGPVRELDGSCFHHARRALERAKRDGRWAVISGMAESAETPPEDAASPAAAFEMAANAILRLTGDIRAGWTDRQVEVIRQRRTTPLQKDVAHRLAVSPSVISEVLRAARHDAVREAEHAVEVLLNRAANPESFRMPEPGQ